MPRPIRAQVRQRMRMNAFSDPRLQAVAHLVHQCMRASKRVSLQQAAHAAHYSPQHFSEFFRERVGVCFTAWQLFLRMSYAEQLLVQKEWMPVHAVARSVGCKDPSTFSRAFKRYAGITPRELRRLARACPDILADLSAIERLDYASALVMFSGNSPAMVPLLRQLAEQMHTRLPSNR